MLSNYIESKPHTTIGSKAAMMEETRSLMDHGWPFAVAVIAVALRLLVTGARLTFFGTIRALIIGGIVGYAVGGAVEESAIAMGWEYGQRTGQMIIAVAAILADDLVMAVILLGKKLRNDPIGTVLSIMPWWRK